MFISIMYIYIDYNLDKVNIHDGFSQKKKLILIYFTIL